MKGDKITAMQSYFIVTLSIGITNHVLLTPVLLSIGKRDAWVGTFASIVPSLLFASLLTFAYLRTSQEGIAAGVQRAFGRFGRAFFGVVGVAYAFLLLSVSLKDMVTWTHITYLPRTPPLAIAAIFAALCGFAANLGIRTIALLSGILLPIVVGLGLFVTSANFQYKDYSLLFPLFTHGFGPTAKTAAISFAGTTELVFLLLFRHHIVTPVKYRGVAFLTIVLVGLTSGPLMGAISLFGPFEAAALRYPPFEQWRMVNLGRFISHLDFLSIYQWLSGAFVRISVMLFVIAELISPSPGRRRRASLVAAAAAALGCAAIVPINDMQLYDFLQTSYFPISMALGVFILLGSLASWRFGKRIPVHRERESE
jgi:spore germination protein (amino acid permease)